MQHVNRFNHFLGHLHYLYLFMTNSWDTFLHTHVLGSVTGRGVSEGTYNNPLYGSMVGFDPTTKNEYFVHDVYLVSLFIHTHTQKLFDSQAVKSTGLLTSDPRLRDCMDKIRHAVRESAGEAMMDRELFRK